MDPAQLFSPDPSRPTGRRWRGFAACAGLFLVGFALAASAIDAAAPLHPAGGVFGPKLEHLESHADEYDVIFVGSSLVYRHVDGSTFDDLAAEAGLPLRSFNAGTPGMNVIELRHIVNRLAEMIPARLRLVVINPAVRGSNRENWSNNRALRIADVRSTAFAIDYNFQLNQGGKAWTNSGNWLMTLGARFSGYGRLVAPLFPGRDPPPKEVVNRGFSALDDETRKSAGQRGRMIRNNPEAFRRAIEPFTDEELDGYTIEPGHVALMNALAERLAESGIHCVFIAGPTTREHEKSLPFFHHAHRSGSPELRAYYAGTPPDEYFSPEYWFDPTHLNRAGAGLFARRLFRDLEPTLRTVLTDRSSGRGR